MTLTRVAGASLVLAMLSEVVAGAAVGGWQSRSTRPGQLAIAVDGRLLVPEILDLIKAARTWPSGDLWRE